MLISKWELLVLLGLSQGCIFCITLLTQKTFRYSNTNKFLAISLLMLSFIGINEFFQGQQLDDKYFIIDFLGSDIPWYLIFYVPMFIFFLKSGKLKFSDSKWLWWLTSPFLLFLTINILVNSHIDWGMTAFRISDDVRISLFVIQYYTSMIFITLLCGSSFLAIKLGVISKNEKKWLYKIWFFNMMILLVWIVTDFMPDEIYDNFNGGITYPVWIAYSVFMIWLMFKGLFQLELSQDKMAIKEILNNREFIPNQKNTLDQKKIVTKTSDIALQKYYDAFENLMKTEKLYRNPDISREAIANKIGISPGYLSKSIKESTNKNFSTLVNAYRVTEVKKMLQQTQFNHFSIWAIGIEAGFKSKSAFFEAFNKETGLTPSQFKKKTNES